MKIKLCCEKHHFFRLRFKTTESFAKFLTSVDGCRKSMICDDNLKRFYRIDSPTAAEMNERYLNALRASFDASFVRSFADRMSGDSS